MAIQKIKLNNVPFQGGVDLAHEIALLETGSFSQLQNVRPTRPGFIQRLGQTKLHTTTDSAQEIISLYQLNKGAVVERHFFAQRVDGSLIEGTNNPPTITTGNFGTEKLAYSSSQVTGTDSNVYTCILAHIATASNKPITGADYAKYWTLAGSVGGTWVAGNSYLAAAPASYGNINDMMIYSDAARQHQIYAGDTQKVLGVHVHKGTVTIPDIPIVGEDYTAEANDGQTTTVVSFNSLNTLANFHCFFIIAPVRINKFTLTMNANVNTVASVMLVQYRNSTGGWTSLTNGTHGWVDGTIASGKTLGQSGSVSWTTMPTDEVPHYSFDKSGFVYRVSVSAQLSASVEATAISFGAAIQDIQNVFDGIMPDVPEARVYDYSKGTYATYAGTSVNMGSMEKKNAAVSITIATPAVVTWTAHGLAEDDPVIFSTTGALPTGITAATATGATTYYVKAVDANSFQLTDAPAGNVINTSGSQSGVHTCNVQNAGDWLYLFTPDPVIGFYGSPGSNPNTLTGEIVGTDIAFVDGGTGDDSITRTTADFISQGFEKGMRIIVSGSGTGGNNKVYMLKSVSSSTLTLQTGTVTAVAAGDTITIRKVENSTTYDYPPALNYAGVYTGSGFTELTNLDDGMDGMSKAGFITFGRNVNAKKVNFEGAGLYAYIYKIGFNRKLAASLMASFQYIPFFDISKTHYPIGQSNTTWKGRACYAFKGFGNILYFSAKSQPMVLNGDDGIGRVVIGDGRKNDILCIRRFFNELLVWQAEKGGEGGSLTLVEGDRPSNFDKLLISSNYGIVNSKSAVVLEGVNIATMSRDKPVATVAYWISRDGVFKTNGVTFENVTGEIANYFDIAKSECIRRGYEDKHWMGYDRSRGVILIGLCSGASATKANKYFVLDPLTGRWSTDTRAQEIYCYAEVEAESGNIIVLQVAGAQDGFVMRLNDTNSDISTAIDASITLEINGQGNRIRLNQDSIRCKVQSAGSITRTIMADGNPATKDTKTLIMTAKATSDVYRRHFKSNKIEGDHLSIKWRHNTAAEPCHFLDFGIEVEEIESNPVTSDT